MRKHRWIGTLVVVLAIGGIAGCDSVSGTAPKHAGSYAPSAPPSPAADPQRLAICDEAQNRAADGITIINEYAGAAPADIDSKRVQKTLEEMVAVEKKMPPALGSLYNGITSPVSLLSASAVLKKPSGVGTTGLRETALLFVAECQKWAEGP
jgi:hypothetical protein